MTIKPGDLVRVRDDADQRYVWATPGSVVEVHKNNGHFVFARLVFGEYRDRAIEIHARNNNDELVFIPEMLEALNETR